MDCKNMILNSKNELDFINNFKNSNMKFNGLLLNLKNDKILLKKLLNLLKININLFNSLLETIKIYNSCNEYKKLIVLNIIYF
jgi:hypothetical protein